MYTHGDKDFCDGIPLQNVQMDNAKPHIGNGLIEKINKELQDADNNNKMKISIMCTLQPARSPDLNKLDMSINRSLAAKVHNFKTRSNNLEELLVINVVREFDEYPISYLERAYAQTFANYRACLRHNGNNDYPSPHEGIRKKENPCEDIVDYYVDVNLVEQVKQWLINHPLPPIP